MSLLNGSIRQQLRMASLAGLSFVLMVGAVGFVAAERLSAQTERVAVSGSALRLQMQADMMHDALRSDVLSALLAGADGGDDAARQQARTEQAAELKEHVDSFTGALQELGSLPLPEAARAAVQLVRPALGAYADSAARISQLAFSDLAAARAARVEFDTAFKRLEDEMETLSEVIEGVAAAEVAAASATARLAR